MKNIAAISIVFLLMASCQKRDVLSFPLSANAKLWVPQDQDSVLFKPFANRDTTYLRYASQQTSWVNKNGVDVEQLSQRASSINGDFFLDFNLETDVPVMLPEGGIARRENLFFKTQNGEEYFVSFYRDTITTDLFVIDTISFNSKLYTGVLTDNATFYYNQQFKIFRYYDDGTWNQLMR